MFHLCMRVRYNYTTAQKLSIKIGILYNLVFIFLRHYYDFDLFYKKTVITFREILTFFLKCCTIQVWLLRIIYNEILAI